MRNTLKKTARTTIFGFLALAVLLGFYGCPLALLFKIFGGVTAIMGFAMDPLWTGTWHLLVVVFRIIPLFLVIWILTKIPGIEDLVMKVLGFGKTIAAKIWNQRNRPDPEVT